MGTYGTYNQIVEDWWKHAGCYDRSEVCDTVPYSGKTTDIPQYLTDTDEWWENLSYDEREAVYEDFFAEY